MSKRNIVKEIRSATRQKFAAEEKSVLCWKGLEAKECVLEMMKRYSKGKG